MSPCRWGREVFEASCMWGVPQDGRFGLEDSAVTRLLLSVQAAKELKKARARLGKGGELGVAEEHWDAEGSDEDWDGARSRLARRTVRHATE